MKPAGPHEQDSVAGEWEEWGPEINGYRFIGPRDTAKFFKQRHRLVHGVDGYYWSYMDLPEYKPAVPVAAGDEAHPEEYTYGQYHHDWNEIKATGSRTVIFPLKTVTEPLNKENIASFLQTSSEYSKVLKIERIRWHPDKMIPMIQQLQGIEGEFMARKITTTFQIINGLYEEAK